MHAVQDVALAVVGVQVSWHVRSMSMSAIRALARSHGAGLLCHARSSKIGFLHRSVAADVLRRVAGDDFAVHQHRYPVGEIEHHAHVVLDHDQGLALAHLADQFHRVGGLGAAHAGGGFVEQDHLGAAGDGDADFQRALLGVGKHARRGIAALLQPDRFHHFFGAQVGVLQAAQPVPERVLVAERPEHGAAQVLEHRHALENIGDLEAARQALAVDLERLQAGDARRR